MKDIETKTKDLIETQEKVNYASVERKKIEEEYKSIDEELRKLEESLNQHVEQLEDARKCEKPDQSKLEELQKLINQRTSDLERRQQVKKEVASKIEQQDFKIDKLHQDKLHVQEEIQSQQDQRKKFEEKRRGYKWQIRKSIVKDYWGYILTLILGAVGYLTYWLWENFIKKYLERLEEQRKIQRENQHSLDTIRNTVHEMKNYNEYIARPKVDQDIESLIGNLDNPVGVILVGEKKSGKTSALDHAIHGKQNVVRILVDSSSSQDFSSVLHKKIGLPGEPESLSQTIRSFSDRCIILNKFGIIPTLVIDDLDRANPPTGEKGLDLINTVINATRTLSADLQVCRVIITVSDATSATLLADRVRSEKGRLRFMYIGDMEEDEAASLLRKGPAYAVSPLVDWKFTEEQINQIISDIGTRPGHLTEVIQAVNSLLLLQDDQSGEIPNEVLDKVIKNRDEENLSGVKTELQALSVIEAQQGNKYKKGLIELSKKNYGETIPSEEATRIFGSKPSDTEGDLYVYFLKTHILAWNPEATTIKVNSKGMWRAIKKINN